MPRSPPPEPPNPRPPLPLPPLPLPPPPQPPPPLPLRLPLRSQSPPPLPVPPSPLLLLPPPVPPPAAPTAFVDAWDIWPAVLGAFLCCGAAGTAAFFIQQRRRKSAADMLLHEKLEALAAPVEPRPPPDAGSDSPAFVIEPWERPPEPGPRSSPVASVTPPPDVEAQPLPAPGLPRGLGRGLGRGSPLPEPQPAVLVAAAAFRPPPWAPQAYTKAGRSRGQALFGAAADTPIETMYRSPALPLREYRS